MRIFGVFPCIHSLTFQFTNHHLWHLNTCMSYSVNTLNYFSFSVIRLFYSSSQIFSAQNFLSRIFSFISDSSTYFLSKNHKNTPSLVNSALCRSEWTAFMFLKSALLLYSFFLGRLSLILWGHVQGKRWNSRNWMFI